MGRAGEERSGWVSHIHTLGVETGYERVLKVAWMSQELLGSGARRRFYKEEGERKFHISLYHPHLFF